MTSNRQAWALAILREETDSSQPTVNHGGVKSYYYCAFKCDPNLINGIHVDHKPPLSYCLNTSPVK